MRWSRNPFFQAAPPPSPGLTPDVGVSATSDSDADADADPEAALPRPSASPLHNPADPDPGPHPATPSPARNKETKPGHMLRRPTAALTVHQVFYIFVLDGVGAGVLSGGINFAVAYAMYTTAATPIRLFQLPNTLAGDAAVTIVLQSVITWLVELVLVNRDLARGGVAPVGFVAQPPRAAWWGSTARWFLFLDRDAEDAEPGSRAHWARFLLSQVVRAVAVAVVGFVLLWGPAVGILTAVGTRSGGDWVFEKTWTPQVFKLVLGGVLGLLQTPAFAAFWLVRAGWALRTNEGAS